MLGCFSDISVVLNSKAFLKIAHLLKKVEKQLVLNCPFSSKIT